MHRTVCVTWYSCWEIPRNAHKNEAGRTSLVVQWLWFCAPKAGGPKCDPWSGSWIPPTATKDPAWMIPSATTGIQRSQINEIKIKKAKEAGNTGKCLSLSDYPYRGEGLPVTLSCACPKSSGPQTKKPSCRMRSDSNLFCFSQQGLRKGEVKVRSYLPRGASLLGRSGCPLSHL